MSRLSPQEQAQIRMYDRVLTDPFADAEERRLISLRREQVIGTAACGWCRHWQRLTAMSDYEIAQHFRAPVPIAPGRCLHPANRTRVEAGEIIDPGRTNRGHCEYRERS